MTTVASTAFSGLNSGVTSSDIASARAARSMSVLGLDSQPVSDSTTIRKDNVSETTEPPASSRVGLEDEDHRLQPRRGEHTTAPDQSRDATSDSTSRPRTSRR